MGIKSHEFSVEIWAAIFSDLTRVGDLYNLSIISKYIHEVANPILYRRIYLDPNYYSIYTLSRLYRDPTLCQRIEEFNVRCFPPRVIPDYIIKESEALYHTLPIPSAKPHHFCPRIDWSPLGTILDDSTRPLFHLVPILTKLTSLCIIDITLPADFLPCILQARNLLTLDIRDFTFAPTLQSCLPSSDLPLQRLTLLRAGHLRTAYQPPRILLCEALLSRSPNLSSLEIDRTLVQAVTIILSKLTTPTRITNFTHSDASSHQIMTLLPAVTVLTFVYNRGLNIFNTRLAKDALPNLTNLTCQHQSLSIFCGGGRPLQYLTIVDPPFDGPWESTLIQSFEKLHRQGTMLKGLSFNISIYERVEKVLPCISRLWQNIRELKIQCTLGVGVDRPFQISFGPNHLPLLSKLEILHVCTKLSLYGHTTRHFLKRDKMTAYRVNHRLDVTDEEREHMVEAPSRYQRWEEICPSLREVAFDRRAWWRRITAEPGSWIFMTEIIPDLTPGDYEACKYITVT